MENKREYARVDVRAPFKESTQKNGSARDLFPTAAETVSFELPLRPSCLYPDALTGDWIAYLDAKIDAIAGLLTSLVKQEETMPLRHISISAGGVGFESDMKLEKGEVLEMRIRLDNHRTFIFYGEVIWTGNTDQNRYRVGTAFLNMSSKLVDEIDYFVFNQQRDMLSRKRYHCNA